ncbi:MAG TPA: hypothetical protein VLJ88_18275 [Propionibacteriaceae bacterium]|nr:hypothetical protein [Propionibacteriaceae bacterium]
MTTSTTSTTSSTPAPAIPVRGDHVGQPSALHILGRATRSELIKLGTVRSTGWVLLLAALSIVGIGVFNAVGILVQLRQQPDSQPPTLDPAGAALSGIGAALVAVAALGILSVTADYSSGMIKTTIAAVPRRAYLVLAHTGALISYVLPVTLGSTVLTFLANKIILSAAGVTISFTDPGVARAVVGAGLYLTVLAVFTAGLGWLLRSTAGALVTWLALWLVPTLLIMLFPPTIAARVGPWLPANVGTAIYQVGVPQAAAWFSLAGFVGYGVVLMVLATVLLRHRDA